ncbi:MAG: hypothetical protein ACI4JX_07225 [Oscillospiraceae bacterium]
MSKISTADIVKGVAVGMAVGTATAMVSKNMGGKSRIIKKSAGKALGAMGNIISALQG